MTDTESKLMSAKTWALVFIAVSLFATLVVVGAHYFGVFGRRVLVVERDLDLPVTPGRFPHHIFGEVLDQWVDDAGMVDYRAIRRTPQRLHDYIAYLQAYSPRSNPELFPEQNDVRAYYLNAYNALVIFGIVENYPIANVLEISGPIDPQAGYGFFHGLVFNLGGEFFNLYELERDIIMSWGDPRVHAVLSWGSLDSPRLRRTPLDPDRLDAQLDSAMRELVADPRNVTVDDEEEQVLLSTVFDWYAEAFLRDHESLPAFISEYADEALATQLARAIARDYAIEFRDHDWRLNERGATRHPVEPTQATSAVESAVTVDASE